MPVLAEPPLSGPYAADSANRNWPYTFKALELEHINVIIEAEDGTMTVVTEGFTATNIGVDGGGTVVYPISPASPIATGNKVRIARVVPYAQPYRVGNQGRFLPETHEKALDNLEMQIQQLEEIAVMASYSIKSIERLTQAAYDALESYEPTTLYIITGE